ASTGTASRLTVDPSPTRRSSDLAGARDHQRPAARAEEWQRQPLGRQQPDVPPDIDQELAEPEKRDAPGHIGREELPRTLGSSSRDRKSTRLNSSHVKISYAVFCL